MKDYVVRWEINVEADSVCDAAKQAADILRDQLGADPDAHDPIFEVAEDKPRAVPQLVEVKT